MSKTQGILKGAKYLLITALIIVSLFLLWTYLMLAGAFSANPSPPEIKYGEFPFKLTYEISGETKIIEDVIVCEFDGYKASGSEKKRVWKTSIKNNSESMPNFDGELIIIDTREGEIYDGQDNKVLEIHFFTGDAGYYLGDNAPNSAWGVQKLDRVYYLYHLKDGSIRYGRFSPDEAYEKIGIRLISWEGSDPIENIFYGE